MAQEGQEHPISTYLWVWILLFVLSACSYYVDFAGFQGFTRWSLVILFMFLNYFTLMFVFVYDVSGMYFCLSTTKHFRYIKRLLNI